MRKIFRDKRFILSLAGIAVLFLLLLASGLHGFEFDEGRPTGMFRTVPTQPAADMIRQFESVPLWKQGAFWLLLVILVVLVVSLLSPELRKRVLRALLQFILVIFALSYLLENVEPANPNVEETTLLTVPLYHVAGMQAVFSAIYGGRTLVIMKQFEIKEWLETVQTEKGTE